MPENPSQQARAALRSAEWEVCHWAQVIHEGRRPEVEGAGAVVFVTTPFNAHMFQDALAKRAVAHAAVQAVAS